MINIFGVIGKDVKFTDVMDQVAAEKGEVLNVLIYSVGGSLMEGLAIYDGLKSDPRKVKTTIFGLGASSASAIFCAGDERLVGDASEYMIHNVLVPQVGGNKHELREVAEMLDAEDQKLISIYEAVTGLSRDKIESMMKIETKLNADQAIEMGFATGKANTMAMVAQFNNKKTEVNNMSELDEKEKGFLAGLFAKCGFNPKAELEAKEDEEDDPKAMEDEEEEAKAEDSEDPKAMEHEKEKEEMKAEIAQLKEQLSAKLDKEVEAEKHVLIFEAIKENKLTLAEGRDSMALGLEDVQAKVEQASISPSGYEKQHLKVDAVVNHADEYLALSGFEQTAYFSKHEESILKEMNKDK
tara:strand:+ start:1076 stop:2137 length:1062 start_codon:yes stop_codon:yes gene_type:complete